MDYRNASIPADKVTSTDVNKAIQRSLTKAVARHGLGLYIYAGEDLPEGTPEPDILCEGCGKKITSTKKKNGEAWPSDQIVEYSRSRYGHVLCPACMKVAEANKA